LPSVDLEFTDTSTFQHQGIQVEGRWALAEWGKLPLNPTLYGEWKFNDHNPDAYEVKLLLGDDIAPRLRPGSCLALISVPAAATKFWHRPPLAAGRQSEAVVLES